MSNTKQEAPAVVVEEVVELRTKTPEEAINDNFVNVDQAKDLEEVQSVALLATGFSNWHTNICNQAVHAMNAPEFKAGDDSAIRIVISSNNVERGAVDGERVLHPQEVEAFKAGIRYLFDMLVDLPFKFIPTDADDNIQPEYTSNVEVSNEAGQA